MLVWIARWRALRLRRRAAIVALILVAATAAASASIWVSATALPRSPYPLGIDTCLEGPKPARTTTLLTLNAAHGRGTAFHPFGEPESEIRANLAAIAALLRAQQPDVVALQEADGPSSGSGGIDHVGAISDAAGFCSWARGDHVHGRVTGQTVRYGTALIANRSLTEGTTAAFATSPLDTKGFTAATVQTVAGPTTVVSVHLDPVVASARERQIDKMLDTLRTRKLPLIILGDLNCGRSTDQVCLTRLASELNLRPCGGPSYPSAAPFRSIDWILVSLEFEFQECRVVNTIVSDHRAVLATVTSSGTPPR